FRVRFECQPDRLQLQPCIDLRGTDGRMIQRLADQGQAGTSRHEPAAQRAPEIVNANIIKACGLPDTSPGLGDVDEMMSPPPATENKFVALHSRELLYFPNHGYGKWEKMHTVRLGMLNAPRALCKVHIRPFHCQDFIPARASQERNE